MARIEKILESNEKRLIITKYLDPSVLTGEEEFITIKKLPYSIKRKIEIISFNNIGEKARASIFAAIKKKGIKAENMNELSVEQKADLMSAVNMSETDLASLIDAGMETAKLIIENSVDKKKHSFIDAKDQAIDIGWEFFERLGNIDLIDFVVEQAKEFSAGYLLGEKTAAVSEILSAQS